MALLGAVMVVSVVLLAVIGPWVAPYSPTAFVGAPFQLPSVAHLLGTDVLGRDVLSDLLNGGRTYLMEGICATLIGVGLGSLVGMVMTVLPRRIGDYVLSMNDTFIVLPQILVSLLVITRLGGAPYILILVVGFAHVPHTARVVRAASQRVVEEDFFQAARANGASRRSLVGGELLPNIIGSILVEFGVRLAASFVVIATLNFLGFGGSTFSWGDMIYNNDGGVSIQPWAVLAPVLTIAIFIIGVNLLRDSVSRAVAARSAR
jgi:peptide/nickel transport system permease protein